MNYNYNQCLGHSWPLKRENLSCLQLNKQQATTNVAYKCKIFEAFNLTPHGYYTHVCTVQMLSAYIQKTKYFCQTRNA